MATPHTFPAPLGVTVAFTNLGPNVTTPNFLLEPGRWTVSLETLDTDQLGDQFLLVQADASFGLSANTTVLTMTQSGYYDTVVGPGVPLNYNFQTGNSGCKNIRITKVDIGVGPS